MIEKLKSAALAILLFVLGVTGWRLDRAEKRARAAEAQDRPLPPGVNHAIAVDCRGRVEERHRSPDGRTEYRETYIPPEGSAEVVLKEGSDRPLVFVKTRGFTSRFGAGIVYSGRLLPVLDWRWAYWGRYGPTLALTPEFGGLGIARHLDDLTPFRNLEAYAVGGLGWKGERRLGLGVRMSF